jgi:hypothetical protein
MMAKSFQLPDQSLVQLRIDLDGIRPVIWRRLVVSSDTTLGQLHYIIQYAMGWYNEHLHEFELGHQRYSDEPENGAIIESNVTLGQCLSENATNKFNYIYDYGDYWLHKIKVEKHLPMGSCKAPICLAGKNACPPEDVGGAGGYYEFLDIIMNSRHPRRKELLEWAGGSFDPTAFNIKQVNSNLPNAEKILSEP